jgi:hypothetical protein
MSADNLNALLTALIFLREHLGEVCRHAISLTPLPFLLSWPPE